MELVREYLKKQEPLSKLGSFHKWTSGIIKLNHLNLISLILLKSITANTEEKTIGYDGRPGVQFVTKCRYYTIEMDIRCLREENFYILCNNNSKYYQIKTDEFSCDGILEFQLDQINKQILHATMNVSNFTLKDPNLWYNVEVTM